LKRSQGLESVKAIFRQGPAWGWKGLRPRGWSLHDASMIYLDHAATTPILPEILHAMLPFLRENFGNPSSLRGPGRRARAAVEKAREQVAALAGLTPRLKSIRLILLS
jgi:selenocysteine lyase/cysteine desulfurase